MEAITKDLRTLCGSMGHDGYKAGMLLGTILGNILKHPDETKYRTLSGKSSQLQSALQMTEFFATLVSLGFLRKVEMFEEKWVLPHLTTILKAKMQDTLNTLEDFLDRYKTNKEPPKPNITSLKEIKEQQRKQEEYWNRLAKEAEEDRLLKLEREERALRVLRKAQEKKQTKVSREQAQFRQRYDLLRPLQRPPRPGPAFPPGQEPSDEGLGDEDDFDD